MHPRASTSARRPDPAARDAAAWALVLPGVAALRRVTDGRATRWLDRLLARAMPLPGSAGGFHTAVARTIAGDAGAVRRWAPGYVCAAEDGIDGQPGELLRLDPVNLQPAGDRLVLGPSGPLGRVEADALAAAIGEALGGDPSPRVGAPDRWYAHRDGLAQADWTAPEDAYGRDIYDTLPRGPGSGGLKRLMNEVQMVLHDHPVNRDRVGAGLPEINSLWAWGWAREPAETLPSDTGRCVADHPYARGLARRAGWQLVPAATPPSAEDWPGRGIVVCDAPWHALEAGDPAGAAAALAAFDRDWCRPLLRAIQRRQLTALRLIADGVEYVLRPAAAWRVWRRRAPAGSGP